MLHFWEIAFDTIEFVSPGFHLPLNKIKYLSKPYSIKNQFIVFLLRKLKKKTLCITDTEANKTPATKTSKQNEFIFIYFTKTITKLVRTL